MENNHSILVKALNAYNINTIDLNTNEIGNSSNLIYEVQSNDTQYILRIANQSFKYLPQYEAESEYLEYLFKNNINVSRIVLSKNNKLVEVIGDKEKCYFVSLFTKARGKSPDVRNINEWNEELFYNFGKTMGKIHCVTKNYEPKNSKVKRKQWNEDIYFKDIYNLKKSDFKLNEIWNELINEINKLPKDKNSYGLIHNDFHKDNFFVYNKNITVFDFDDCLYSWYICDIAIAIYHSIQTVPKDNVKMRKNFEFTFIENFLKGYVSENYINKEWIKKIPLFLEYRRICSYKFFMKLFDNNQITKLQKEYLNSMKEDIVNRIPVSTFLFEI